MQGRINLSRTKSKGRRLGVGELGVVYSESMKGLLFSLQSSTQGHVGGRLSGRGFSRGGLSQEGTKLSLGRVEEGVSQ